MDAACAKALEQIEEKDYVDRLRQDGMRNFIKYGIACFKKDCKVWLENNKNLFTNRRRYARFLYKLIVPFISATGNGGICYTQKRTS
jgi:hypothetical protein